MAYMTDINLDSDFLAFLAGSDYEPGDRLPTISELQREEYLNISISKIREQLEVARAMGLVEVRSKTGMRLQPFSFTPAVRLSLLYALAKDINYFEMFGSLRIHIETAYWQEACNTLTDDDLKAMRQHINTARQKLGSSGWIQIPHREHREFHLTVFKKLDNPFVIGLLEAYWDAYEAVELNRYADYDYHQRVWDFHEQILNALCAGDFELAKNRFVEHTRLLRVQPRMQHLTDPQEENNR